MKTLTFQNMTKRSKDICRLVEPSISGMEINVREFGKEVILYFGTPKPFKLHEFPLYSPFRSKIDELVELILTLEKENT